MTATSRTETKVADRYVLQDPLGKGGMGVVWRAQDLLLQRPVAIKEIRIPNSVSEEERAAIEERSIREARAAASLNHPNAVAVFDVLKTNGRIFIVMELIDAPTLAETVADHLLSPSEAAGVGLQVLDALEAAHAKNIVHRDVKPANVMVSADGTVKLADFGIASVKGDPRLTASGMILGSPAYMAPEQAQHAVATTASDVWALGATLFMATEGLGPFDRGQPIPTLTAVMTDEPSFSRCSGPLRSAIEACLRKDPVQRPTVEELRGLLRKVGAAPAIPIADPKGDTPSAVPRKARVTPARSRQLVWILAAGIAAAGMAAIVIASSQGSPSPGRNARSSESNAGTTGSGSGNASQASLPEGWALYTDSTTGYEIGYPEGWEIETGNGTPQSVDLVDPETGAYMRIDWTDTPGDSPQATWESYEEDFAATHENYERITIEPTTFQTFEASHWEYTWGDGLHAVNLGFVTGEYGFALNYQAPEEAWDALLETFETSKETFSAPG